MSVPKVRTLVLDTSALLSSSSPITTLQATGATNFFTIQAVLDEVRDKVSRDILDRLDLSGIVLKVREPSSESLAKVNETAKRTGDIASLSRTDMRILALLLTVVEQVATDNQPERANIDILKTDSITDRKETEQEAETTQSLTQNLDSLHLSPVDSSNDTIDQSLKVALSTEDDVSEDPSEDGESDSDDSNDSEGWITPGNVDSQDHSIGKKPKGFSKASEPEVFDFAIMSGDNAVQNVGLQLGLNVIGVGGKRIKDIRTWVLRCHGCFKICKDTTKVFCPSCGGNTLLRTSITYVTPSPKHPQGYILHLKRNYQYRLRGTQYSIPNPKWGRAENIILREDQKEFQRGVKKENIRKQKEEKARDKGDVDDTDWIFGAEKKWLSSGGMPTVGYGRKNPNEAKKKRR